MLLKEENMEEPVQIKRVLGEMSQKSLGYRCFESKEVLAPF